MTIAKISLHLILKEMSDLTKISENYNHNLPEVKKIDKNRQFQLDQSYEKD